MPSTTRHFAVITGASTGIGYELAKCCAARGCDLLVAADEARIEDAARDFRAMGAETFAVEADLSTVGGVEKLWTAIQGSGRPADYLLANAGRGLGGS